MVNYVETKIYKNMEELIAKDNEWTRQIGTLNKIVSQRALLQYREDNKQQYSEQSA